MDILHNMHVYGICMNHNLHTKQIHNEKKIPFHVVKLSSHCSLRNILKARFI